MPVELRTYAITEVAIARLREPAVVVARGKAIAILLPIEDNQSAEWLINLVNDIVDAALNQSQDNPTSFSKN